MNLTPPVTMISSAILIGIGYLLGSHSGSPRFLAGKAEVLAQTGSVQSTSSGLSITQSGKKPPGILEGLDHEQIKALTLEILKEPNALLRMHRYTGLLAEMSKENWKAISDAVIERHKTGADTSEEGKMSQFREGQVLGALAMDEMPREPNGVPSWPARLKFEGWASEDPATALQWLQSLESGKVRDTMLSEWKQGLAKALPNVQAEIFPQLKPSEQTPLVNGVINGMVDSGGMALAKKWYEDVAQIGDPTVAKTAFASIVSKMTQSPMNAETAAFIETHAPKLGAGSEVFRSMCYKVAPNNPGECVNLLQKLSITCPDVAQNLDSLLARTVKESTTTSLNTMGNWLNQNPNHPLHDQTLVHFVNQCQADDPEAAARWANTIKDETLRAAALKRLQVP